VDLFNQIRKKLVIFVHFKGFNISQKPKSSPLSYFAQKTFKFGTKLISDNFYVSISEWFLFLYFKYWYFRSLKRFWDCDFNFINVLELHHSMEQGQIQGGAPSVCSPPLKLEKNMIFWCKIVIFHTKYPKNFVPPSAWRNYF
jgi:hypothetical protein